MMNEASPYHERENPLNKSSNDVFKRLAMRDRKKTVSVNTANDLKPTRQTSSNHMLVRNNSNFSRENSADSRDSEIQRVTEQGAWEMAHDKQDAHKSRIHCMTAVGN